MENIPTEEEDEEEEGESASADGEGILAEGRVENPRSENRDTAVVGGTEGEARQQRLAELQHAMAEAAQGGGQNGSPAAHGAESAESSGSGQHGGGGGASGGRWVRFFKAGFTFFKNIFKAGFGAAMFGTGFMIDRIPAPKGKGGGGSSHGAAPAKSSSKSSSGGHGSSGAKKESHGHH